MKNWLSGFPRSEFPVQRRLSVGFGFAKADDAVALFPLAAFFQNFDALKSFEDVAFAAERAGGAETAML